MPPVEIVFTTVDYAPRLRPLIEPAVFGELDRADVAVLAGDLDDRVLRAPRLKWVHCDHAGLEKSARPEVFERGLIVTGSAGRSAPAVAEHAMFFMLSRTTRRRSWTPSARAGGA